MDLRRKTEIHCEESSSKDRRDSPSFLLVQAGRIRGRLFGYCWYVIPCAAVDSGGLVTSCGRRRPVRRDEVGKVSREDTRADQRPKFCCAQRTRNSVELKMIAVLK